MSVSFSQIFGQKSATEWLLRAYSTGRLPHGLIFAGPKGVGKATAAAAMGKLFLCHNPKGNKPCDKCESCQIFEAGNHPDYHVITRELIRYHDKTGKSKGIDLSIQVIRPELIEPAARKANLNHGKVFVVEQAETMNPPAQNALLKTLEEPAGLTLIILLTDQLGALLPTIRSRCQTVTFAALDVALVRDELRKRGIEAALAEDAARLARGSLGVALGWIRDGVITWSRELIAQMDQILAGSSPDDLPGWLKRAADDYAEKQLERDELASRDQLTREGMVLYFTVAADYLRDRLKSLESPDDLENTCRLIDQLAQAESYLESNVNVALVLQNLAASMTPETRVVSR